MDRGCHNEKYAHCISLLTKSKNDNAVLFSAGGIRAYIVTLRYAVEININKIPKLGSAIDTFGANNSDVYCHHYLYLSKELLSSENFYSS